MTRQKSDFTEPLSSDQPTQLSSLTSLNSSAVEGDRASLVCQVKASHPEKGYTVSWLRANDTSVLSVGLLVFSSDRRFSVRKINKNVFDIWSLEIYPTWSKDEGWYQCQINTEPKTSHQCYLTVYNKAPTMARIASRGVEIKGDPYQTFTQGEEMRLECVLPKLGGDGMANSLKWTKTPEKNRGIKYEKKDSGAYFSLVLIAESVSSNDQGSYTCGSTQDSFLPPAQVFVRVREISIHDRLSQLEQRVAYLESQSLTYSGDDPYSTLKIMQMKRFHSLAFSKWISLIWKWAARIYISVHMDLPLDLLRQRKS